MTTNKGFNRPLNTGHDVWLSARVHSDFYWDSILMGRYSSENNILYQSWRFLVSTDFSNWMQHILILSFVLSNVFPSEPKIKFGKWFSARLSDIYPCQYPPREWGFISSKIRGPKANIFDTSNPQPLRIGAVASNIYIIVLKQWANFLTFQGFILSKESKFIISHLHNLREPWLMPPSK